MPHFSPREAYETSRSIPEAPLSPSEEATRAFLFRRYENDAPQLDAFADLYSREEIARDSAWTNEQRQRADEKEHTERAVIFERMLRYVADYADWFGEGTETASTSEFDDRAHHADFVLELPTPDNTGTLRIAVDATTAHDVGTLERKITSLEEEIQQRGGGGVKYFISGKENKKMRLTEIPRVIVGIDTEGVRELAEQFARIAEKTKGAQQNLAAAPEQLLFLEEVRAQLIAHIRRALFSSLERPDGTLPPEHLIDLLEPATTPHTTVSLSRAFETFDAERAALWHWNRFRTFIQNTLRALSVVEATMRKKQKAGIAFSHSARVDESPTVRILQRKTHPEYLPLARLRRRAA